MDWLHDAREHGNSKNCTLANFIHWPKATYWLDVEQFTGLEHQCLVDALAVLTAPAPPAVYRAGVQLKREYNRGLRATVADR